MGRTPPIILACFVLLAACSTEPMGEAPMGEAPAEAMPSGIAAPEPWPEPPTVSDVPLNAEVASAVERLVERGLSGPPDPEALATLAGSGDARLSWLLADLMRLAVTPDATAALRDAFADLSGADPTDRRFGPNPWLAMTNLLIGWDLPAPPGYAEAKAALFLRIEPAWAPFFDDAESTIDWRATTWGGVLIDDRPAGATGPCERGCIPALDDPTLTSASEGDWYPDDRTVFGISLNGEAVALPKHMMEVHEMVNLTLGGRRLGIPYCTLCASAQAYLVDAVPGTSEPLVLRTSGLLSRSNKLMYDLVTRSAFHTFTGRAASGPLREAGVTLEPIGVTVSTWGEWKAAHPRTRIVARDGGIGRVYPDDPLCGRDDAGPIFPIGPADPRLPVHARVVGVIGPAGDPVAFAADTARSELAAGRSVEAGGVRLSAEDALLVARDAGGTELVTHESFWFAWSQFHPATELWAPPPTDAPPPSTAPAPIETLEGCQDLLDPGGER